MDVFIYLFRKVLQFQNFGVENHFIFSCKTFYFGLKTGFIK